MIPLTTRSQQKQDYAKPTLRDRGTIPFPKRAIHLDFHTMPGVHDVGRDFNPDVFARTLKEAKIEYVTVFARCNLGFAYYPTKIGIPHPSLKTDLLGPMVQACHQNDIQVAAYFNAGLDHEHALRHREWCKVDSDGSVYHHKELGHFFRRMCLNTGYGPHLLAMVKEVLDAYPVDGIFLDCFNFSPCFGIECLDGAKKMGLDPLNDQHMHDYCWEVNDRFRHAMTRLVRAHSKNINLYLIGLPFRWQPTHLELEVLPTASWGYDVLPWQLRYARTVGLPCLSMTGRFHGGWGDFGGLRTEASLLFDCYNAISNAGGCSIGDHMHPRGELDAAVYDLIGRVYLKTAALDPWITDVQARVDMAILDPTLQFYPPGKDFDLPSVAGASRMLSELKFQYDVIDGLGDFSTYKVIVLPDHVLVADKLQIKLQKFLKSGGFLISSGDAGLNPEKTRFALCEYQIAYEGPEPHDPSFFVAHKTISCDLPKMPITIYKPGCAIRAKRGGRVLARLFRSYFNQGTWDRYHANMYMPPDQDTGRAALIQCKRIYHFSFPIFSGYYEHAVPAYKQLVKNCLDQALPNPLVKTHGIPSFGRITVTGRRNNQMVHLLCYVPELRGKQMQVIEEPIKVRDAEVALRIDNASIRRVYLAPDCQGLDFQIHGGYLHFIVPEINGYQLVVVECKGKS